MKIDIKTIPHRKQRYPTCGDYYINEKGNWNIRISETGNWRYNLLIAIHELVEMVWVVYNKVPIGKIDDFDEKFENDRALGKHTETEEPGDSPKAPYHKGHVIATHIERLVSMFLDVNWKKYEETIYNL